ncbi:hypothetical protein WJX72_000939 [[Myrmecia] bisecta]|uniref:Uncharacterized protein n=1 Tax=[Myrmecia] bisecta TaxID=41462 RepID=A0AAW1QNY3_9CHLO
MLQHTGLTNEDISTMLKAVAEHLEPRNGISFLPHAGGFGCHAKRSVPVPGGQHASTVGFVVCRLGRQPI